MKSKKPPSKTAATRFSTRLPIVAVGASAGGLAAISNLLSHLPTGTGMAVIILQHLDPKLPSLSADILSRVTRMPVIEVKNGMRVQANRVYILPPAYGMSMVNGALQLTQRTATSGPHIIDHFFQSLAQDQKELASGVVLSGTGNDGTLGLIAIKSQGGITFAQAPKSAKFDGMPQSAIDSGSVDLILSTKQIAEELARIAHHPYLISGISQDQSNLADNELLHRKDILSQIFLMLRNHCHMDFSLYKTNTVKRRIERRMVLHKIKTMNAYARFISKNKAELNVLSADILIHVTSFFRDPKAFEALKSEVFPKLIENRQVNQPLRIWVPGCSTGEEVYSIAITLLEYLGLDSKHTPIQIFATDISEKAIKTARLGEFPETIREMVSKDRLKRFFTHLEDGKYKIAKSIRDICIFSKHDLTHDSPFAKIDLVSCRNLLIYFTSTLQKHIIPIFHYSLVPNGILWLGKSESIGEFSNLFSIVDRTNKTYMRREAPVALNSRLPYPTGQPKSKAVTEASKPFVNEQIDPNKIAEKALQSEYPGVLVNSALYILQLRGVTAPFIELASGAPSYQLLKMIHPELRRDLQGAIQEAKSSKTAVRKTGLSIGLGRQRKQINLNIIPIGFNKKSDDGQYLIIFEKNLIHKSSSKTARVAKTKSPHLLELREELESALEHKNSLIHKFETAQEDLTTANEELQSANEELQSTNEELETAKEELQSGNEELTTVNDELQSRSVEQIDTNNDLVNLLGSVEIPIVMLGNDRRVRRFTPLAGKALNLIPTDIGRPLSDLRLNFKSTGFQLDLEGMVTQTIETLASQEVEVQDLKGRWFRLQVRPYKTVDHRIDGAVIALVDIDSLKKSYKEVSFAQSEAEKANRAKDLFLATLSHELRTPLTAILSWAELFRSGKLDAEKIKRGGEIIEESGKAQAQLINDLLDVSRIIVGKLALDTKELEPATVLRAAIEAVRPLADKKSIEFELAISPLVGSVIADAVRLQQIFWNLLTNAVKFSQPNSKVKVHLERVNGTGGQKPMAVIQVIDSGKGIHPEFLPHIFDRFSQEDNSSVRLHGGLGLGLAIVKNLVELQGGTVRAENSKGQSGATFTVLFPIHAAHGKPWIQPPSQTGPQKGGNLASAPVKLDGIRVLLVDDDLNAREAFSELLQAFGAKTKTASSAKEALSVFTAYKPHILVSDIAMPEHDGYFLVKKIRELGPSRGGDLPTIALTAHAGDENIKRVQAAGFDAYLSKPVDGQNFARTIIQLVGRVDTASD